MRPKSDAFDAAVALIASLPDLEARPNVVQIADRVFGTHSRDEDTLVYDIGGMPPLSRT